MEETQETQSNASNSKFSSFLTKLTIIIIILGVEISLVILIRFASLQIIYIYIPVIWNNFIVDFLTRINSWIKSSIFTEVVSTFAA